MVLCRFFARGYCRYGNNCRFEHSDGSAQHYHSKRNEDGDHWEDTSGYPAAPPSYRATHYSKPTTTVFGGNRTAEREQKPFGAFQSKGGTEFLRNITQDVESWEEGNQWMFTCYAPIKDGENLPEFCDISPEEWRWNAYQAEKQGTLEEHKRDVAEMVASITMKRQQLKNPTSAVIDILNKIASTARTSEETPPFRQSAFPKTEFDSQSVGQQSTFSFKLPPQNNPTTNTGSFGFPKNSNTFETETMQAAPSENTWKTSTGFTKSLFGGSSTTPQNTNLFNQNNQSTQQWGTNSFGEMFTQTPAQPTVQTFSFKPEQLSNQIAEPKSTFKPADGLSTNYSSLELLTENEKRQFLAGSFTLGSIPEKPPPRELCII